MTMLDVVAQLQSQGHQINFYIRKDGGILIKSIDGQHYQGAKGNTAARAMQGVKLSEARYQQLKYATKTRITKRRRIKRTGQRKTLDEQIQSAYDVAKKKWNKAFKAKNGKPHPAGYFGWERIEYAIEHYGKREALRRIGQAELYASGIAYSKNVEILAAFIKDAADKYESPELKSLAEDLISNAYQIRDEWIYAAYESLYDLGKQDAKTVAQRTRKILRL